jgi:hypothetical protein
LEFKILGVQIDNILGMKPVSVLQDLTVFKIKKESRNGNPTAAFSFWKN